MKREMKIGDKVLCIDGSGVWRGHPHVIAGNEYKIIGFISCTCGDHVVIVDGFDLTIKTECSCGNTIPVRVFSKSRFVLPDIEELTEILTEKATT